jgi:type II secretory pathway component GspD/PulD (secretin)
MPIQRSPGSVFPEIALLAALPVIAALGVPQARCQAPSESASDRSSAASQRQTLRVQAVKPDAKKARQAYQQGLRAEQNQDWQTAYEAYSNAGDWAPTEREYLMRLEVVKGRLVQTKVEAAERSAVAGQLANARSELLAARYLDPKNTVVRDRLAELAAAEPGQAEPLLTEFEPAGEVHLDSRPGTHSFDYRGDTEGVYEEVARQFAVEVAFDTDLVSRPVRLRADDLDFPSAMRVLGEMTGTFWRPLTEHLFFVAADTAQKRRDYDTSVARTILLPASESPQGMTETLRLVREITGITRSDLDTRNRTLTLRASPRAVAIASGLVEDLERPVGELILEMEVLQVDRNYARNLGITPPESSHVFTLSTQQIQQAQQSLEGLVSVITQVFGQPSSISGLTATQISSLLSSNQLSLGSLIPPLVAFGGGESTFLAELPGASANFSQMLSLVQSGRRILLRAEDGQPATFFVGSRIPVSLAQFSSSLGGTSTNLSGVTSSEFPTTNYSAGKGPTFVATGSLRNSTTEDLVVANFTDNTISVLLGNNDGTFQTQKTYPTGAGPVWIATGKFNTTAATTQNLDLAVANQNANTISIFLGKGDGTFTTGTSLKTGVEPVSVIAANLNDKGGTNLDLAVANHGDNTISIYFGSGDGTFKPPTIIALPSGYAPSAIAAADFNKDGHLDLAVTDEGKAFVSVFLGNGDGTFGPRQDYPTGGSPVWVSTGDFDGDGIQDLAIANKADNTVSILLGNRTSNNAAIGDGTFGPETIYAAGNGPTSIAVADFNIDGRPDLAVADQTGNTVSILLGTGAGVFTPILELPVGTTPVSIVTGDFNGDGKPDVAVANNGSEDVSVILDSSNFSGAINSLTGTPFPGVEYLDVGLKVKATPRIHQNDEVTLHLEFELSSITAQSFNTIPVISNQTVNQTVRVKENETAALAGILEPKLTNVISGTPGIEGLPGIGWLAQNENRQNSESELLILVTPRMVRLAARKDHVIYAGRGSLDRAGAPGPVNEGPVPPGPPGFVTPPLRPLVPQPEPQQPNQQQPNQQQPNQQQPNQQQPNQQQLQLQQPPQPNPPEAQPGSPQPQPPPNP